MREIRFRGWHNVKKEMILPPLPISSHFGDYHLTLTGLSYIKGKYQDVHWMQYVGLKDKNSVEIYEGDILTPKAYTKTKFANCIVTFKKGMFCFEISKPFIASTSPLYESLNNAKSAGNDFTIIGNIYENEDLI